MTAEAPRYRLWFDTGTPQNPDWWVEDDVFPSMNAAADSSVAAALSGWRVQVLPEPQNPRPDGRWDNPIGDDDRVS